MRWVKNHSLIVQGNLSQAELVTGWLYWSGIEQKQSWLVHSAILTVSHCTPQWLPPPTTAILQHQVEEQAGEGVGTANWLCLFRGNQTMGHIRTVLSGCTQSVKSQDDHSWSWEDIYYGFFVKESLNGVLPKEKSSLYTRSRTLCFY